MGIRCYFAKITSMDVLDKAIQALRDHNNQSVETTEPEYVELKQELSDEVMARAATAFGGTLVVRDDGVKVVKIDRYAIGEPIRIDRLTLRTSPSRKSVWLEAYNEGGADETMDFFHKRPGKCHWTRDPPTYVWKTQYVASGVDPEAIVEAFTNL
jgi:hypothetical protein